ncbi:MAG: hypothetical protein IFNCLDLE_02012 [Ignavibacteriaceae bacterium]|nr:hypothetical protein [Ignavibacteriaceae bacterium]
MPFFIVIQSISNSYMVRYVPLCRITQIFRFQGHRG